MKALLIYNKKHESDEDFPESVKFYFNSNVESTKINDAIDTTDNEKFVEDSSHVKFNPTLSRTKLRDTSELNKMNDFSSKIKDEACHQQSANTYLTSELNEFFENFFE